MKKNTLFLLLFSLIAFGATSQNLQWQRSLGLNKGSGVRQIDFDNSGNVFACGWAGSPGPFGIYVSKYDTDGNLLWMDTTNSAVKICAFEVDDHGNSYLICSVSSEGAYFGPYYIARNPHAPYMFVSALVKYDRFGQVLWAKRIEGPDFTDAKIMSDGNFYATGKFDNYYGTGNLGNNHILSSRYVFLAKYDLNGTCHWIKQLADSTASNEAFEAGAQFSKSDVKRMSVVYSSVVTDFDGNGNLFNDRNVQWQPFAYDNHGALYLMGSELRKWDTAGANLMSINFGNNIMSGMHIDAADRLYLSEYQNSAGNWYDSGIREYDHVTGQLIWKYDFTGAFVVAKGDGKGNAYAFGGYFGGGDGILAKFNANAPQTTDLNASHKSEILAIYPNPTSGHVMINIPDNRSEKIVVRNIFGNELPASVRQLAGEPLMEIDLSSFADGVYFIERSSEQEHQIQKVIVRH